MVGYVKWPIRLRMRPACSRREHASRSGGRATNSATRSASPWSRPTFVPPSSIRSRLRSGRGSGPNLSPLTKVPLRLSRSEIQYAYESRLIDACCLEIPCTSTKMSFCGARPMVVISERGIEVRSSGPPVLRSSFDTQYRTRDHRRRPPALALSGVQPTPRALTRILLTRTIQCQPCR